MTDERCKVIITHLKRHCASPRKEGSEYCTRHSKLWDKKDQNGVTVAHEPHELEETGSTPSSGIPKNKEQCPRCKKIKRTRCFVFNTKIQQWVCRTCNRSEGNNKFFIPLKERRNYGFGVGKYSVSDQERRQLYSHLISCGFSPERASSRVNYMIRKVRSNFWRAKGRKKIEANRKEKTEMEKQTQKKEFLEGLK